MNIASMRTLLSGPLKTTSGESEEPHPSLYSHMPRVSLRSFRTARALHPHLAKLLPVCRDLRSARNELRWIRERVHSGARGNGLNGDPTTLSRLVRRRARGEPLQYVLGTEFFGDLELKCRPGVLIPRPETAASVTHLVSLLAKRQTEQHLPSQLRVIDMCTGTGCIPLLFHDEFYKNSILRLVSLDIKGYDISHDALDLSCENRSLQLERLDSQASLDGSQPSLRHGSLQAMDFVHFDVLSSGSGPDGEEAAISETSKQDQRDLKTLNKALGFFDGDSATECDVLISNPPYISPSDYTRTTARSVKQFEPKLALVPPASHGGRPNNTCGKDLGDLFYPRLLDLAERLKAKFVLLEVADIEQAKRVVAMVLQRQSWDVGVDIWRDEPSRDHIEEVLVDDQVVKVVGEGNGRSVFIWRKDCDAL